MPDPSPNPLLPVLASCAGCGACCSIQGAPPDYVALSLNADFRKDPSFREDVVRSDTLPDEARALLAVYLEETATGTRPTDGPCVWLDAAGTACRFYEWRPSTCRLFERNSPGCQHYRKLCGFPELPTPQ